MIQVVKPEQDELSLPFYVLENLSEFFNHKARGARVKQPQECCPVKAAELQKFMALIII